MPPLTSQGPKEASRLAKGEAPGALYDYEDKINFAVFPSLQVRACATSRESSQSVFLRPCISICSSEATLLSPFPCVLSRLFSRAGRTTIRSEPWPSLLSMSQRTSSSSTPSRCESVWIRVIPGKGKAGLEEGRSSQNSKDIVFKCVFILIMAHSMDLEVQIVGRTCPCPSQ